MSKDAILTQINESCKNHDFSTILTLSKDYDMPYFGMFLSTAIRRQRNGLPNEQNADLIKYHQFFSDVINNKVNDDQPIEVTEVIDEYRVALLCNWLAPGQLEELWSKMLPSDSRIVLDSENPDYWVIINKPPPLSVYDPSKTIVFQMEPFMTSEQWGEWATPDPDKFLRVFTHQTDHNNIEWHLSQDHASLSQDVMVQKMDRVSAVLSDKYSDPGHIKRVDFVKYIENDIPVDVFGNNLFMYKLIIPIILYFVEN